MASYLVMLNKKTISFYVDATSMADAWAKGNEKAKKLSKAMGIEYKVEHVHYNYLTNYVVD